MTSPLSVLEQLAEAGVRFPSKLGMPPPTDIFYVPAEQIDKQPGLRFGPYHIIGPNRGEIGISLNRKQHSYPKQVLSMHVWSEWGPDVVSLEVNEEEPSVLICRTSEAFRELAKKHGMTMAFRFSLDKYHALENIYPKHSILYAKPTFPHSL